MRVHHRCEYSLIAALPRASITLIQSSSRRINSPSKWDSLRSESDLQSFQIVLLPPILQHLEVLQTRAAIPTSAERDGLAHCLRQKDGCHICLPPVLDVLIRDAALIVHPARNTRRLERAPVFGSPENLGQPFLFSLFGRLNALGSSLDCLVDDVACVYGLLDDGEPK